MPPGAVALPGCVLVVPPQLSAWCQRGLGCQGTCGGQLAPAVAPQGLLAPRGCFSFFHWWP